MPEGQSLKKGRIRVAIREASEDPFPFLRGSAITGETGKYHSGNGVKDSGKFQLQEHAVDLAGLFINIFYGEDVTDDAAAQTLEIFQRACPNAEIVLQRGGQPVYYYMISAE